MDDKRRTKLLASGLAAVVAVYSLRSTVDNMVMKPIRDAQKAVQRADQDHESLARDQLKLRVAQRNLEDWRGISLPPNLNDAQRLYREWLYDLTRQCGFSGPGFEVAPGTMSPQKEYSTVTVEIKKAETDLQGLARFLYLFEQAGLMHRITGLKIDSPGAQGNPRLSVSFTAEGMSVTGTADRSELLPRSALRQATAESDSSVVVAPNDAFPVWEPFEPFLIRVERELMKVEAVSETGWKVQRGVEGTKPAAHASAAIVELLPVAWNRREKTYEDYVAFVNQSMFVIPSPPKTWSPRLAGVSDLTIKPGGEVRFTARAESYNPELGEPLFALTEAAEGMTIDPQTGEFQWKPAESVVPGKYSAVISVTQEKTPESPLTSGFVVTIKAPNTAPEISLPAAAVVVIGREFSLTAKATDDGSPESLRFSLGSGTPEGLTIDETTGQLQWTPARTFTPGRYDIDVRVTDAGDDPQTSSKKITLDVQDDNAAMTLLSGTVSKDSVWYGWFRNKGTGQTSQLKVGDQLTVSEIAAEIVEITNRYVTLRDEKGLWKLALGDGLRDRKLIAASAETPPANDTSQPSAETDPLTSPAAEATETPDPEATPTTVTEDGASEQDKDVEEKNSETPQ